MRKECLDTVYELAKNDSRITFIGSDLGYGTLKEFKKNYPSQFFMEGVNEAGIVGMASGMAMEGRIVYFNTITTFITRRAYEQVCLDACLHNVPVRFLGNGGGLVYAPLGPTHLAIEDLSIMRAIPNLMIIAPADPDEMINLMRQTAEPAGPIYVRIARGGELPITKSILAQSKGEYRLGRGYVARDGQDLAFITTGVTLHEALKAADILAKKGIHPKILHFPTIKPFDSELLFKELKNFKTVLTIEENTIVGGLGGLVSELFMENSYRPQKFKRMGIPDVFPDKYGNQASLMKYFGLEGERIANAALNLLEEKI